MTELEELKIEIEKIKERNRRVESDKMWETSTFRHVSIAVITYIFIAFVFMIIEVQNPFVNAIIPTCGYLLSTLSLSILRDIWLRRRKS